MPSPEIADSQRRLLTGLRSFREEIYPERKDAYKQLIREGQKPHALFITCADSRIDPELLTRSGPGEIFVLRNIGNLVPAYGEMLGGVSAVIEYSVLALSVSQVVICGHTDCGAMKGLLHPDKVVKMPTVKSWLKNGEAALSIVQAKATAKDEHHALEQLIEENVLLQMSHLRTHPSIAGKVAQGTLAVAGWVYDIEHGTVRIFDEDRSKFVPFDKLPVPGLQAEGAIG
jgi:carbonic anhydrase